MPLLRFDVIEGRSQEDIRSLLDSAHRAMLKAFGVPERDRYQIVHQHSPEEMVIQDTGLGYERTNNVVVITVTTRPRSSDEKQNFYRFLIQELKQNCQINPNDVVVSMVTNDDPDWSFGLGEAQFVTGSL